MSIKREKSLENARLAEGLIDKSEFVEVLIIKKVLAIALACICLFGLIGCDSKKNIPSLAEVSQMNYEEANKALSGQDIQKIREAWGEPIDSDDKEAMWQVDSSMIIEITHSNSGVVESCELLCGTPLAPMDE